MTLNVSDVSLRNRSDFELDSVLENWAFSAVKFVGLWAFTHVPHNIKFSLI